MGKLSKGAAALVLASLALGAEVASATTQPTVLYQPPVLKALDHELHNSEENMVVEANGRYALAIRSEPVPMGIHGESAPGCGFITGGVTCPAAGLTQVVMRLGAMNDSGIFDLGRLTGGIRQKMIGGVGDDELVGRAGRQRLVGGPDDDILRGGRGRDLLIGGDGVDACFGGPGRDVLRGCE